MAALVTFPGIVGGVEVAQAARIKPDDHLPVSETGPFAQQDP
jgi:hypothetical protein